MDCRNSRELMHEWLEELLEPAEAAAISNHVAVCRPCQSFRDTAGQLRGKVRAALTTPHPEITFSPPPFIQMDRGDKRPSDSRSGWAVEKVLVALAAALLLLAAGGFLKDMVTLRNMEAGRSALAAAEAAGNQARDNLEALEQSQRNLVREYSQAVAKAREEANNQPVRVVVNGPGGVIGGAPTQFLAQAIDPNGRRLPMRLEASLEAPGNGDQAIALDVVPQADGIHRISLPPDAPVRPGTDPVLKVRAFPDPKALRKDSSQVVAEVTERIQFGLSPLTTHLSTDKRLYQAGEFVRFRSLTLDRATLQPPQGPLKVRVRLIFPDKTERLILVSDGLMARPEEPNRPLTGPSGKPLRGIAAGEIPLESGMPPGEYTLRVEDADGRFAPSERKFMVQVYRKPVLNKELTFSKRGYAPGETVQVSVRASALDGKPVTGQAVKSQLRLGDKIVGADGNLTPDQNHWVESLLNGEGKATFSIKLPTAVNIGRGEASLTVSFTDGSTVESMVKPVPLVLDRVEVGLFPESGDLVAGLPARVYFTARTRLGKPTDLEARLLENGKTVVDSIRTLNDLENPGANQGMGSFEFTPKAGADYSLELLGPSKGTKIALPTVKTSGITLRVEGEQLATGGKVPVRLRASEEGHWFVGLYCRGRLLDSYLATGKESLMELAPPAHIGGVCRLTAFRVESAGRDKPGRGKLTPVAERLLWRPLADNLKVDIRVEGTQEGSSTSQPPGPFSPGDKVRLKARVRDAQGNPTGAILLASVVDQSVVTLADEKNAQTMPTHFLLGEEVLHPEDLEYADFLLTANPLAKKAMDLLLGTQGWRRFAEQDPAKFQADHPVEAPDFLVSSGLGRQQATLSSQGALENKIRDLAPVFDGRFRSQRANAEQAMVQLDEAGQKVAAIQAQLRLGEGSLGHRFTLVAGTLGLGTGLMSILLWLTRGQSAPARLALSLGTCLVLVGSVIWLSRAGKESTSPAEPVALGALGQAKQIVAPMVANQKASSRPKNPIENQGSAAPLSGAETAAKWLTTRGQKPALEKVERPLSTPSALLGAGRTASLAGEIQLSGIDRMLLPQGVAEDPHLFPSLAGEDIPPLQIVREYSHVRLPGNDPSRLSDSTETPLWKPVWVLPSGEGVVEFALPDSASQFIATVAANTEDGRLASTSTTFEVKPREGK